MVSEIDSIIWDACERLEQQTDDLIDEENYKEALTHCEEICRMLLHHPVWNITLIKIKMGLDHFSLKPLREVVCRRYISACGKRAYVNWLLGDKDQMEQVILNADSPSFLDLKAETYYHNKAREKLAGLVSKRASALFGSKKWTEAATAYAVAKEQMAKIQYVEEKETPIEEDLLSKQREKEVGQAEQTLLTNDVVSNRVSNEVLPIEYNQTYSNLLAKVVSELQLNEALSLAHGAFDAKDWSKAASCYDKAIRYLFLNGYGEDYMSVAECRYNMAMAYWNDGQYDKAIELLVRVSTKSPSYQPLLVREQLDKLIKAHQLFGGQ